MTKFTGKITDLKLLPRKAVIAGDVYTSDDTRQFFEFTLLHSYPKTNSNRMTFLLSALVNSVGTANHQPMNREHKMEGNPGEYGKETDVIGAMIKAYIPDIETFGDDIPEIPDDPVPVKVVGVLWKRFQSAQDIISDIHSNISWSVSMEALFDSYAFVAGDKIFTPENKDFESIETKWSEGKFYDGSIISMALGGTEKGVNFWGSALTLTPADDEATIDGMLAMATEDGMIHLQKSGGGGKTIPMKFAKGADMPKFKIESDGDIDSTTLTIGEEVIEDATDIYFSVGTDWDNDPYLDLSFNKEVRDGDVVRTEHYKYDPAENEIAQTKEAHMGTDPIKLQEAVDKQFAELAKQKGYLSPEEVDAEKAKVRDEYNKHTSPDDLKAKIADERKQWQDDEKVHLAREEQVRGAGLEVTVARQKTIREFKTDDDKAFKGWISEQKENQQAMKDELKESGIDVTDAIQKELASIDSKDTSEYQRFVNVIKAVNGDDTAVAVATGATDGDSDTDKQVVM